MDSVMVSPEGRMRALLGLSSRRVWCSGGIGIRQSRAARRRISRKVISDLAPAEQASNVGVLY